MFRNRSVNIHQFSMIPRAEIPRSSFSIQTTHKTTFDAGYLIPVFVTEVLPGDTFSLRMTAFARLATPIFPVMDNLYMDSFFFFVPNRLVWSNWVRMMGEQDKPTDSTSYTIPTVTSPTGGFAVGSLADYFGLPTVGQVNASGGVVVSALPFRAYNLIYNEWFRDQNLIDSITGLLSPGTGPIPKGDGPDALNGGGSGALLRRGKRHDYFTSCLPFTQKGNSAPLPLTGFAPVGTATTENVSGFNAAMRWRKYPSGDDPNGGMAMLTGGPNTDLRTSSTSAVQAPGAEGLFPSNLVANLGAATATTINQLRLSFQTQRLMERDARGGTRYTEKIRSHFGVVSPDARLQRPEYLGGGSTPVNISPVAQTSNTPVSGTPQGNLAAFGTVLAQGHGFRQSFSEHGFIIGLVSVRADLTYQQGLRKMWSRRTQYDHYFPVFAMLGEQAVLNQEIYCVGDGTQDQAVFGYQSRWDEYRFHPSMITGLFRSTSAGTLDAWHLAQRFTNLPTLNTGFMNDDPPIDRVIAVPTQPHFLFDSFFDIKAARPMPMFSVPGMIDHF